MTQLSVNVNKIATLRNARGGDVPSVLQVSRDILAYGSYGITVHPRPDERHIKKSDVVELSALLATEKKSRPQVEFNVEGYPSADFMQMIESVRPDQCTLVPDPPDVITSNAGWKFSAGQLPVVSDAVSALKSLGVRSSIFVDPYDVNEDFLRQLKAVAPDRVELYTEMYAKAYGTADQDKVIDSYKTAAMKINELGIGLNAGHDLNQENLRALVQAIPSLEEVSIGHALISEALYQGLEQTVGNYLELLK